MPDLADSLTPNLTNVDEALQDFFFCLCDTISNAAIISLRDFEISTGEAVCQLGGPLM